MLEKCVLASAKTPTEDFIVSTKKNGNFPQLFLYSVFKRKGLPVWRDDYMIFYFYSQDFAGCNKPPGRSDVGLGGICYVRWMVMGQNNAAGIFEDGQFENLSWMGKGCTGCSHTYHVMGNNLISGIQ